MTIRTLGAFAALAAIANGSLFAQQDKPAEVGDHIVIQMTGDLATEYGKRTGVIKKDQLASGLQIETTATVSRKLDDGRIRVEHTSHIVRDDEPARLVTLTATVESAKLTTDVMPKGTPVFVSPTEHKNGTKPTLTTAETRTRRLTLSDLKGLKLRTWTLAEEVGD
jgi:hypothetical protein